MALTLDEPGLPGFAAQAVLGPTFTSGLTGPHPTTRWPPRPALAAALRRRGPGGGHRMGIVARFPVLKHGANTACGGQGP